MEKKEANSGMQSGEEQRGVRERWKVGGQRQDLREEMGKESGREGVKGVGAKETEDERKSGAGDRWRSRGNGMAVGTGRG